TCALPISVLHHKKSDRLIRIIKRHWFSLDDRKRDRVVAVRSVILLADLPHVDHFLVVSDWNHFPIFLIIDVLYKRYIGNSLLRDDGVELLNLVTIEQTANFCDGQ